MQFIADVMLGKLARWLRILGFDTWYSNKYEDDELIELGEKTCRILLTFIITSATLHTKREITKKPLKRIQNP